MKVIGLTGGTGSGKGVVGKIAKKNGAEVIDADKIAHEIIKKNKPAYEEIISYFGSEILQEDGEIVRKKLGEIVFFDTKKMEFLNQCTHKYITHEILILIEKIKLENQATCILLDAPLLIEAHLEQLCEQIWVVYAPEAQRIERIIQRDGICIETALARIASQKDWVIYESFATHIIDNSKDLEEVEKEVKELLKTI